MRGDTAAKPQDAKSPNDVTPWSHLMFENAPQYLLDRVNNRNPTENFADQRMSAAWGLRMNFDQYVVRITKLPPDMKDAAAVLTFVRLNLALFINGKRSDFEAYSAQEAAVWNSSNPNSAVMRFRGKEGPFHIDDADVLTTHFNSSSDYASWTFRPVYDGYKKNFSNWFKGDKGHPLGGNREFGVQKENGGYIFYIQGVDRLFNSTGDQVISAGDIFFKQADEMWRQVMVNVANAINAAGGEATFDTQRVVSKRVWYSDLPKETREKVINNGN
ncbi:hypothetical protein [Dinghuibacter silviterrae]|uniref:hypothetical protein n=1 Tax=Dinghuibacter silviterrae TaxID=1539049 RepID=UPI0010643B61|nr:hypothetical protein [Dinghuibacter silviterrae]